MTAVDLKKIADLLVGTNSAERRALLAQLLKEFPIHALEKKWNTTADVILEAIARSNDLTQRGVRGVIAEASFKEHVLPFLDGWKEKEIVGNDAHDFVVGDSIGDVRIQVKLQRSKEHRPMTANQASKKLFSSATDMWVVETQRTRGGKDRKGNATRPYKFREFDILAVNLHPSANDWSKFRYGVVRWLISDPKNKAEIFKYQPVPKVPNDDWTDDLAECIGWFRSERKKRIRSLQK